MGHMDGWVTPEVTDEKSRPPIAQATHDTMAEPGGFFSASWDDQIASQFHVSYPFKVYYDPTWWFP